MSNSATIRVGSDETNRGLYLHWNGGCGTIAAFLEETKIRLDRGFIINHLSDDLVSKEEELAEFYAVFYGVARDFMSYCSSFKDRTKTSVKMKAVDVVKIPTDNGNYDIRNDFSCSRIDMSQLDEFIDHDGNEDAEHYEEDCYDEITAFFDRKHAACCVIEVEEEPLHYEGRYSTEELKQQLQDAELIESNATIRTQRLKTKVKYSMTGLTGSQIATMVDAV